VNLGQSPAAMSLTPSAGCQGNTLASWSPNSRRSARRVSCSLERIYPGQGGFQELDCQPDPSGHDQHQARLVRETLHVRVQVDS
jgi:hypothetical protein